MNLKESFRYQNFLDNLMEQAELSIGKREHCLRATRTHLKSAVNPDASDLTDTTEIGEFTPNDTVINFMIFILGEKQRLSEAIVKAKNSAKINIDSAVETNRFRQRLATSIKMMLNNSSYKQVEQGRDYKFNAEGNQVPYFYSIEAVYEELYDRGFAKDIIKKISSRSDIISSEIDEVLINTKVEFDNFFDMNDDFEDAIKVFKEKIGTASIEGII